MDDIFAINESNKYEHAGHINIYQSLHNLNTNDDFKNIGNLIKKIVEKKIPAEYSEWDFFIPVKRSVRPPSTVLF